MDNSNTSTTLLSTNQLLNLLDSIYTNIESRIITVDPLSLILIYDANDGRFYQTTYQAMWDATDPVKGIENNLNSDKIDFALSAYQGQVLRLRIEDVLRLLNEYKVITNNELTRLNNVKLNNEPTPDDLTKYYDEVPTDGSLKFVTSSNIKAAIARAIVGLFKFIGNAKSVDKILHYHLQSDPSEEAPRIVGYVYNAIEAGIIFLNGVDNTKGEISFKLGDNLVWTDDGWDVMASFIDLTPYATIEYVDSKIGYIGTQLDIINNEVI